MIASATSQLRQRWSDWWEARLPRQDQMRLTQRNLYILPTRAGWGFAAVVSVLLLAAINEQINLGYALARRRISLALRSSRFSRSRAFMRSRSSLV